jgi:hypothetical protein
MSNSPLVTYTKLSPNHSGKRTKPIDTITIHCVVGHCTVKTIGDIFASPSRQASSNYSVDDWNGVGLYVDEANRSWCTSSRANDQRAITIEVASDTTEPYAFTASAYKTLTKLVVDICKRNGIKKLVWSKNKNSRVNHLNGCNLTVHRDYANKSCPGNWMYGKMGEFAAEVNKRLGAVKPRPITPPATGSYTVKVNITDLNIRRGPGTNYKVVGQTGKGVFTIVGEALGAGATKWGKLKSGAGWISLDFVEGAKPVVDTEIKLNDIINFKGGNYFVSSTGGKYYTGKPGKAKVTQIVKGAKYPYHVIRTGNTTSVYGWVAARLVSK